MTTETCAGMSTDRERAGARLAPSRWHPTRDVIGLGTLEPLTVPAVVEGMEAVVEHTSAPAAAAPALLEGLGALRSLDRGAGPAGGGGPDRLRLLVSARVPTTWSRHGGRTHIAARPHDDQVVSVDEYAKAVLYNGLGHHRAAQTAALRACEREDFELLDWALAELVEAGARSGSDDVALTALRTLEGRALDTDADWLLGLRSCCRALLSDRNDAERHHGAAVERLSAADVPVALGRGRLLYGEWLRREGRRVDAREQLRAAQSTLADAGMGGFAERARRELLATGETVRKRVDDTRTDLTPQEAEVARLAADGCTNPEIGEQLFISPRTVEWHLRKVFTKLGVSSRRDLRRVASRT